MIKDSAGTQIDTWTALERLVAAIDHRFPDGNTVFQRVSRLCEETGELAAAVNHTEQMGIKIDKHGLPNPAALVKEIHDVMRAAIGIARHYGLEAELEESIGHHYRRYEQMGHLPVPPAADHDLD